MAEEIKYEIDNTYVHYVRFGHGPKTLVIISGISLRGFEGFGAAIAKQYEIFQEEYTCFCFDRRRYLNDDCSIYDLMEDICGILRKNGIEKADFFGVSQGGMIAQAMALVHPEIVGKLALGSTAAYASPDMVKTADEWCRLAESGDVYHFNMAFYRHVYSPEYFAKYEKALERLACIGDEQDLHRMLILNQCIRNFDSRDRLCEIKCPCFVIGSEKDEVFGAQASVELAEGLGCGYYIFENASHAAYDEIPEYLIKLKDFLDQ